jgi:hypothetical protein
LRQAARKLKPSGFIVTSLPNIAHGDVRIALMNGSFPYGETGLLDRTHLHFFTLESIRQMMEEAGLVVVDTKRVVIPLFQSELGVTRAHVSQRTLDELHTDPEVESYQYVMKSVRDNGDSEVAELSHRVSELTERVHNQRMRIALLRREIIDNRILHDDDIAAHRRDIEGQRRYIEALNGHVSGLEHNIEILTRSLTEAEERHRAALATRAPLTRGAYNRLRRILGKPR